MTAELLAHNVAAHWVQAGALAGVAWLGVAVLRLRGSDFLLRYWQAVILLLLLTPWVQPRHPVAKAPAGELPPPANLESSLAGVADISVAGSIIALPAERWSVDPWTWILGVAAAGVAVRLAWVGLGLVRLGRLARSAHRVAPPEPAREFLTRFGLSAAFVQPPDVPMPCSFGLFRPTVVLPAAFDRLEPAFQRAIVCHELVHLERRDFVGTLVEEVVSALLWFHPWVWLIRRRIRLYREQAVDAAVVRCTGDRRAYVRCLVALAGHPRALGLAAPMLRSSELRARADALFEKEGTMSRRRSTVLAMGLCAVLGVTMWMASAAVPLSAATPVPPDPATATVPVAPAPAMVPPGRPAPLPSRPAAPVPPSVAATTRTGAATTPTGAAALQEPGAGQTPQVQNRILLEFTLPSGRRRLLNPEGELSSITLRDAGTLGFVARRRDNARGVVTVTVFDLDSDPDRELGAVDVTVGGDPVTFQGSMPFEIAAPGILHFVSPPSRLTTTGRIGRSVADDLTDTLRGEAFREWVRGRNLADQLFWWRDPEQANARERTTAVMEELQQALAAISDELVNQETASGGLVQQFAELQERFAELQELLASQ